MKVVLFCGGLGMRIRDYSDTLPKPMVPIGDRPILWHVMKYYAHHGHKDFVLCLGYKGALIKDFFLRYDECVSNDFVYANGGKSLQLIGSDIQDWTITFVDTGLNANIGQRLLAVREHLKGEARFLANYTDGLSDVSLPDMIRTFDEQGVVGSFVGVRPNATFHWVEQAPDGLVTDFSHVTETTRRVNGGFFIFRQDIFNYLREGEELVEQPFRRLIAERRLSTYRHDGFWACMDTVKELTQLEQLYARGNAPWEMWKRRSRAPVAIS